MRKWLLRLIAFCTLVIILAACSSVNSSNVVSFQKNTPSETFSSTKEENSIADITKRVLVSGFKQIDRIYLDGSDNKLICLQSAGKNKSAVAYYSIKEDRITDYKTYETTIAKIKVLKDGLLLFEQAGKIIRVNKKFEEAYNISLPEDAFSVLASDITEDEKHIVYLNKKSNEILYDTIPLSCPKIIKGGKDVKNSGGFISVLCAANNLIFYSYQTEDYPLGYGICGFEGKDQINKRSYNNLAKAYQNGLYLYQSMEMPYDNQLLFYDLNELNASSSLAVQDKLEAISTTISNNGKYIMTLTTDEAAEKLTVSVYDVLTSKSKSAVISDNGIIVPINLGNEADCFAVDDNGEGCYFLFNDDTGIKLFFARIV